MIRHLEHSRFGQIALGAVLALIACSATIEGAVRALTA